MHVGIVGSGKWALLIHHKLKDFGINSFLFGSNKTNPIVLDRSNLEKFRFDKIFIASSTKDHFKDLEYCLSTNPKFIFVEKGFHTASKKLKINTGNSNVYILSQYKFSKIFQILDRYNLKNIIYTKYYLTITNSDINEWLPHIISINNYLHSYEKEICVNNFGIFKFSNNIELEINKGLNRKFLILVDTFNYTFKLSLGINNSILVKCKLNNKSKLYKFLNEDCLKNQLNKIINDDYSLLSKI